MYKNCCKKCGSLDLHTEIKGGNTGLYCSDCGAWIKWLGKDELRAFENAKNAESLLSSSEIDINFIKKQLNELIEFLDEQIEFEMTRKTLSNEDSILRCSTALAYEKNRNALINIMQGKKWDTLPD